MKNIRLLFLLLLLGVSSTAYSFEMAIDEPLMPAPDNPKPLPKMYSPDMPPPDKPDSALLDLNKKEIKTPLSIEKGDLTDSIEKGDLTDFENE